MYKTGIVRDNIYIEHDMGPYHPESPQRLTSIYAMLDTPEMKGRFQEIPSRVATKEEICWVHNESYYDLIEDTSGSRQQLDPDTSTSPMSFNAAVKAAGGTINALDAVYRGEVNNAFAFVRPPGHHSEANRSMGFCIFNNIAIAAQYALKKLHCKKVAIVDWDLHHGNGTQNSFFGMESVFYCSTHRSPFFPGSGDFNETGWGAGEGKTLNIPLSPGYGDGDYFQIYEQCIKPVLMEFSPDILLVSVGYDIHYNDPLGGMLVTPKGFDGIMHILMEAAEACCDGKLLAVLEGGYNIEGQTESIKANLSLMLKGPEERQGLSIEAERPELVQTIVNQVAITNEKYWDCFKK